MWPIDDFPEINVHSYIGVIIAIVGNILISVALNVQKYAHNQLQPNSTLDAKLLHTSPAYIIEEHHIGPTHNMSTIPSHDETDEEDEMENVDANNISSDSSQCSGGSSIRSNIHSHNSDTSAQSDTISGPERVNTDEFYSTDNATETEYLTSKAWWLGMVLMIIGEGGNFMAYGYAQASIVAPLGTVALISNVILAPLMLKESFRRRDLVGIIIAIIGTVVVVINSKENETKLTPEAVVAALLQTQFIVYFIICCVLLTVLIPLSDSIGNEHIFIDLSIVAIFGGYTVLATKGVSSLVSLSFYKMFTYPIAYLLVFVLVLTAVLQIKFLNKSLQRFDSTQVIPTQFVLFTTSAIVGSGILYNDFDEMDFVKGFHFLAGCCMTFLGVYFITSKRDSDESNNATVVASAEWAFASQTHLAHIQRRPSIDSANASRGIYTMDNNRSGSLIEQGRFPTQPSGYVIPQSANRPIRYSTVPDSLGQGSTTPLLGHSSRHSIPGPKDQLSFITSSMHNALATVGSAVGTHHTALLKSMYGHNRKLEDRRDSEQSLIQNPTFLQRPGLGSRSSSACSGAYPQYSIGTHPSSTSLAQAELNYGTSSQSTSMQYPRPSTGHTVDPRYQAPHLQERSVSQDSPYRQPSRKISTPYLSKEQKEPKELGSLKIKTVESSGPAVPRRKGHMFPSPSEQDFVTDVARSLDSVLSSTPKATGPRYFPGSVLSSSPPNHTSQGSEYAFQTLKSPVSGLGQGHLNSYQSGDYSGDSRNHPMSPFSDHSNASLPPLPPTDSGSQQQSKKKKKRGSVVYDSETSGTPLQTRYRQSYHGDDDRYNGQQQQ
ncbi:hypothetical protein BGZ76_001698 [Entomortierella beljakovae]|nr:hypothetical protein BGZ76_001698 [Entomortierella beljakovae]